MAYDTGTAADPADLLAKLSDFAAAQGWTVNRSWTDSDGAKRLLASGDQYVGLRATDDAIYVKGATGVDTGADYNAQPGASPSTHASNNMAGPYTAYHLFGTARYVHCVVAVNAGLFKHIVFGALNLYAPITGGAYVGAIYWYDRYSEQKDDSRHSALFDWRCFDNTSCFVRADIDGRTDSWASFTNREYNNTSRAAGVARREGFGMGLYKRSPNTLNALTPLIPVYVLIERDAGLFSPLGTVPDMRFCNCAYITPGDTLIIGNDEWLVFPFIQKNGGNDDGDINSGTYAWAYKKGPA